MFVTEGALKTYSYIGKITIFNVNAVSIMKLTSKYIWVARRLHVHHRVHDSMCRAHAPLIVITECAFIAVCKKLVKTQINTILAHEIVKAISQESLAQLTWSLLQPF